MYFKQAIETILPLQVSDSEEPLAELPYDEEIRIKQQALQIFFEENKLKGKPKEIIRSPKARYYRTTSKRRLSAKDGRVYFSPKDSVLEPKEHTLIYKTIHTKLSGGGFYALSCNLNWIIIRGSYEYRVVIFNVHHLDATIVRKLKQFSKLLQESPYKITAFHVYVDPTRSDYYLESLRPTNVLAFKQMYGPKELSLKLENFSLRYPVTGFSQINESQIKNLLATVKKMANLDSETTFMDLYCGYGLFALGIGENARNVIGAEIEGLSVECAKASAKYLKRNCKFITGKITESFIEQKLPPKTGKEVVLLDPPRKGTDENVIKALAKRNPEKVIHIFCGTDEIPKAMKEWKMYGYYAKEIQPMDLFPGTEHLETVILFER